jgi:hypothetical protein
MQQEGAVLFLSKVYEVCELLPIISHGNHKTSGNKVDRHDHHKRVLDQPPLPVRSMYSFLTFLARKEENMVSHPMTTWAKFALLQNSLLHTRTPRPCFRPFSEPGLKK